MNGVPSSGARAGTDDADRPDHRHYVGPRSDYDLMAGVQFGLLFALGLREDDRVMDLGCGSLRAGRLLIPYLAPDRYRGVEPNRSLVESGIAHEVGSDLVRLRRPRFEFRDDFELSAFGERFDWVLAQSILSHTYRDLTSRALRKVSEVLAPGGLLVATYVERRGYAPRRLHKPDDGAGWLYPGCVGYRWQDIAAMAEAAGMAAARLDWHHPRQVWFLAGQDRRLVERRAAGLRLAMRRRGFPERVSDDVVRTVEPAIRVARGYARRARGLFAGRR